MNINTLINKLSKHGHKPECDLLQDIASMGIGSTWLDSELHDLVAAEYKAITPIFKSEDDYIINLANNSQQGAYNVH